MKARTEYCWYDGHREGDDHCDVKVTRKDGYYYSIRKEGNDNDVLEFIAPIVERLSIQYQREKKLEKILNIRRRLATWICGLYFYYDYFDGVVEIYDITEKTYNFSQYDSIKKLFNLDDQKTHKIIKDTLEEALKDKVKEIIYKEHKWDKKKLEYNVTNK